MLPIVSDIASKTVSLLAHFLPMIGEGLAKKAGEEFGKSAGLGALGCAKQVYQILKNKFSEKQLSSTSLDNLIKEPNNSESMSILQSQLEIILKEDKELIEYLANTLKTSEKNMPSNTIFNNNFQNANLEKSFVIGNVNGDINL